MIAAMLRCLLALFALILVLPASAAGQSPAHGFAVLGTLKYGPDFRHFDYVNPDAPKGGRVTLHYSGSYDSLNPFILKGQPAAGSNPFLTAGNLLTFETLMAKSQDEPDSYYGLIAESVELPEDRTWIRFRLRPQAKWHDGSPITAEDVAFSFNTLKAEGNPAFRVVLDDVTEAIVEGPRTVLFRFRSGVLTRDLPVHVAMLPIISKAWYTAHRFNETTLEPPLASGPYKVGRIDAGRAIEYERVPDYWGADLPVNRGRHNFGTIRYDYYRDRDVELEALFAGRLDFREDFTSRDWATKYDVPPIKDGRMKRETLPDDSPSGFQAFFLNVRRDKFADPRVRRALALLFDFEWTNANLFYGLYERTTSIFQNSDLMADAPPTTAEIELLQPFRGELPPEVFENPYVPPKTDGSGNIRPQLREAAALFKAAGWTVQNGAMVSPDGKPLEIEFLSFTRTFDRIILPYVRNLERLGIRASFRLVEPSQYTRLTQEFNYDVVTVRFSGSLTPGVSLRNIWGSAAADLPGSQNMTGLKSKAVDALVEQVIAATTRDELRIAARALDRAVMWQHVVIPQWNKAAHTIAYWDIFGRPARKPDYDLGFLDTWWIDPAKRDRINARR
jgi:microcin C transport system substrate-binding protein